MSIWLSLGLCLNGICYMIPEAEESSLRMFVKGSFQGLALVFLLVGIAGTFWRRGE